MHRDLARFPILIGRYPLPDRYAPLPGFPEAPLWIIVTFYIVAVALLYFGWAGRGAARVITMVLGGGLLAYTVYPNVDTYFADHPGIRACVVTMWTSMRASCWH